MADTFSIEILRRLELILADLERLQRLIFQRSPWINVITLQILLYYQQGFLPDLPISILSNFLSFNCEAGQLCIVIARLRRDLRLYRHILGA